MASSKKKRVVFFFSLGVILLVLTFLWSVNTGAIKLTSSQLLRGLFIEYDKKVATVYDLRFPRIFIAILGGAAVAVSGVLLQAVMRNPLSDPGILGISSGASFVAIIIIAFLPKLYFFTPIFAFLGGILTYLLIYFLSWTGGSLSVLRVVLVGVALNMFFLGIMSAFDSAMGNNMSGVASIVNSKITLKTWKDFETMVGYVALGLCASLALSGRCNLLSLEDKTVRSLGIDVNKNRTIISLVAVLLASISTAVIGPISFLGLIVPHISRLLVGTNHKILLPFSMLLGGLTFLFADTVGRTIVAPYEVSPSIIMSIVGGPFFILLLRKTGGAYGK